MKKGLVAAIFLLSLGSQYASAFGFADFIAQLQQQQHSWKDDWQKGGLCQIQPGYRAEGGWKGISKDQCLARDMCWNSSNSNAKWCFAPLSTCAVPKGGRLDAGWSGISREECESHGACYNDSERDANWCFYSDTRVSPGPESPLYGMEIPDGTTGNPFGDPVWP